MKTFTIIATAAMGLEAIVANEIKELGYKHVTVENGKVMFEGDAQAVSRANMWLRTADRIKILAGTFKATSFEELFEQTKAIDWDAYIHRMDTFPVTGKSVKSALYSVPDCQKIVKKAIVEKLKDTHKVNWFDETGPRVKVEVAILKDEVSLTIDTSGTGLHKRGYRYLHNEAPLKETLAAAMIQLTNWHPDRPFADLFTGSGTLPIEAALIGQNIAPGTHRSFDFQNWSWFDHAIHDRTLEEAEDLANYDQPLDILGTDLDPKMIELAENNAMEAGLGDIIQFKQMRASDFKPQKDFGVVVSNPPYGERMQEKKEVEQIYRELGQTLRPFDTWSIYMISSHPRFELLYGQKATKKRKLYNGTIRTDYFQFWGEKPPRPRK
ncbi:THUMP domain-containing class I SAM-dependent RNA methyltransferase [Salisediminibacterium selenitireducens]|uniref:RNA methylase n=1 Tax=Bacillus selenitireducens (strain ATCC 700615 / DSM 15326 / MLS10) TaxID=439292 RepID=D6XUD1_BACIE|nr:class I SAM-dependent RNA methyltransferase [Salisediminibacterium selenitireducens]ADH99417.1 putative RNA methylase [[Bacillus] selenitireducens MLS10]